MILALKNWIKARWPRLRLRTIVFATLFVVAALPGLAAMFLRVYENTLVRQTEAELVAQGAALAAVAAVQWPGAAPEPSAPIAYRPEPPTIDLSSSDILDERPASVPTDPADADAVAAAQALAPVLARTKQTTLSSILFLDGDGTIARLGPGAQLAGLPEVAAARAGRPATVLRRNGAYRATYRFEWLSRAAALRVHHARPIVVNGEVVGVVLLSRSARSLFKGLYADRGKIILGIFLVLLLLLLLTGVLSRGIVRPVEALGRATRDLASGRGSLPDPPKTAAIEIQDLYRDFQRMADAIERRSRYLRDFAHAVSHEFKTPLSGIRGALEILADHGEAMSEEDRRRFLANADADAGRLALLSTRLLELARADLSQGISSGRSDLCEILQRVADAQRHKRFDVVIDCGNDLPSVSMEEASLDAIVTAFIENSRQAEASRIAFRIEAKGDFVHLSAKDDGVGIPAADRNRVFEPFFTTRRASGGSGLGLPIVKSLVEAAGGDLRLEDSEAGAHFSLDLPVAS